MNFQKIHRLIIAALLTAIICIATFIIKIPLPATGGYVNFGDCFVLISGIYLGSGYGAVAAGLGSAIADLLSGYAQYAPATFVIKALSATVVFFIYKAFRKKHKFFSFAVSGAVAESVMVLGYFAYEGIILKYGMGALGSVFPNIIQGVVAVCAATVLGTALSNIKK